MKNIDQADCLYKERNTYSTDHIFFSNYFRRILSSNPVYKRLRSYLKNILFRIINNQISHNLDNYLDMPSKIPSLYRRKSLKNRSKRKPYFENINHSYSLNSLDQFQNHKLNKHCGKSSRNDKFPLHNYIKGKGAVYLFHLNKLNLNHDIFEILFIIYFRLILMYL